MNRPTDTGPPLRFGPDRRIRKRPEFLKVYEEGRKARAKFVVVFCRPSRGGASAPWRLGITATVKTGKSTRRNRQRRRVRDYFRTRQYRIANGWDFVVNTKGALNDASHEAFVKDMTSVLERLGVLESSEPQTGAEPTSAPRPPSC